MFFYKFCEIFKNTFCTEHTREAVSVISQCNQYNQRDQNLITLIQKFFNNLFRKLFKVEKYLLGNFPIR